MSTHVGSALLGVVALAIATPVGAETLPVADVHPGMRGVGRTVFEGSDVEEFDVEVIGVLENGPRQQLILARLEGGPLAETGVIAGMSGSPVFLEGKLVGAVSYGFPFSKETIAGITPIDEMIAATETDAPRPAAARATTDVADRGLPATSASGLVERLLADPDILGWPLDPSPLAVDSSQSGTPALRPLTLPVVFTGFEPGAFGRARELFGRLGFTPIRGAAAGAALGLGPLPDLEPGAAVGVSLIQGDLDVSVTGTVTHIDGDRVYAFGHPFYNLGPTQFPMKKAYVYSVFPSLYQSWKISTALDPVGTIEQDRVSAIAGTIGATPRMIPVELRLRTSRGQERRFSYQMVDDELFTPVLAYVSVLSVLQANERALGTSTMTVDADLELSDQTHIRVGDVFARDQPSLRSAILVAAPLSYLMSNDFESVRVERLRVDVTSLETVETGTLSRAWLEREGRVRPGSQVTLKVQLRSYRGETETREIPIPIPTDAVPGQYSLLVGDADALDRLEQSQMRSAFVPRDLDQLVRAINSLRRSDQVYARLFRSDRGAIVDGEYLPSLPPSVMQVLGSGRSTDSIVPIATTAVWDQALRTKYAVSGSRLLSLTVER